MNVLEIPSSCRLCLCKSSSNVDIFDANGEHGFRAAEVINEILQLDVFKDDGFSEIICNPCLTKIIDFKRFKCMCLESKHKMQFAIAQKNGLNPKCWTSNWCYLYNMQENIGKEKAFKAIIADNLGHNQNSDGCENDSVNIKAAHNSQLYWMNDESGLFNSAKLNTLPQADVLMGPDVKSENDRIIQDSGNLEILQSQNHNPKSSMYILEHIPKPGVGAPKVSFLKNDDNHSQFMHQEQNSTSDDPCIIECVPSSNLIIPSVKVEGNIDEKNILNIGEYVYKCEPINASLVGTSADPSLFQRPSTEQIAAVKMCCTPEQERLSAKIVNETPYNISCPVLKLETCLLSEGSNQSNATPLTILCDNVSLVDALSLKCDECGHQFLDEPSLRNHVESGQCDTKVICCIKCKKNIAGLKRFQKHLKWCGVYQCPVCQNVIKGKEATRDHVRSHFPNRRYACNFCFARFEGRNDLVHHVSNQHGNRIYKCDGCDKSYLKKVQYKKHILKCNKNVFICNACNSPYMRKYPLKLHIWKYHMNLSSYKCRKCDQKFNQKTDYDNHILICKI